MKGFSQPRAELKRNLGEYKVLALAVGSIIGWGCFMLPSASFLPDAGPAGVVLAFCIGAFFQCLIALSYSFLIKPYPVAGGAFAYAYAGFGRKGAFICGWGLILSYICVMAADAMAMALLMRHLTPGLLETGRLYAVAGWSIYAGEIVFVSLIMAFFAWLNYRGLDFSSSFQVILSGAMILGIFALAFASFTAPTFSLQNFNPLFSTTHHPATGVILILALTPWLFVGYDSIPQAAEEFRFAPDKARRLMLVSIFGGAFLYCLVSLSVAGYIPYIELVDMGHPWAMGWIAEQTLGLPGLILLAIPVFAAILTGVNGFFMAAARLLFSMGRSSFMPAIFARLHPRHNTPHNAILFILCISLTAPWLGQAALSWIVDMSAFGIALAYFFTSITAYKYIAKHGAENKSSHIPRLVCILAAVASLFCFFLLVYPDSPAVLSSGSLIIFVAWTFAGLCFYLNRRKTLDRLSTESIRYMLYGDLNCPILFNDRSVIDKFKQ